MRIPDFKRDFKDYKKFDIGAMGEFDVAMLIEQYVDKATAKRMYPEWRGGYYYAAKTKAPAQGTASLGLLYVSRWSTADKASEFASIYAHSLKDRYSKVESAEGMPGTPSPSDPSLADSSLKGRHTWNTEEGSVIIETQGDTVMVSESLDAATTAALEKEVFGK